MKPGIPKERAEPDGAAAVDEFMRGVDHPLKPALEKVRSLLRAARPAIAEGIKWNSPSFRLAKSEEWFATIHLHPRNKPAECVLVVLHQGARGKGKGARAPAIRDPDGLLEWLGKDRATVRFRDAKEVAAKQRPFQAIVRQWIDQL